MRQSLRRSDCSAAGFGGWPSASTMLPHSRVGRSSVEARRELTVPLDIVATAALPARCAADGIARRAQPWPTTRRQRPNVHLHPARRRNALSGRRSVADSSRRARWSPMGLVFALVLTATASAAVGIPLVRRMRQPATRDRRTGRRQLGRAARHERRRCVERAGGERSTARRPSCSGSFRSARPCCRWSLTKSARRCPACGFRWSCWTASSRQPSIGPACARSATTSTSWTNLSTELVGWMEADAQAGTAQVFAVGTCDRVAHRAGASG